MFVIAIHPIASFTVPISVMMMVPIFVVPVVISAVVLGKSSQRSTNYQAWHEKD
jgi:hypothetical protein